MRRTGTGPLLLVALALSLAIARADAQDAARAVLVVTIEPPARITVGDRGTLVARVTPGPSAARPLLVTPSSEGAAVEIVQGRFTRADARDGEGPELSFEIPFVARAAGTSVVRVRVDGFDCDASRCRGVQAEDARAIDVLAR